MAPGQRQGWSTMTWCSRLALIRCFPSSRPTNHSLSPITFAIDRSHQPQTKAVLVSVIRAVNFQAVVHSRSTRWMMMALSLSSSFGQVVVPSFLVDRGKDLNCSCGPNFNPTPLFGLTLSIPYVGRKKLNAIQHWRS